MNRRGFLSGAGALLFAAPAIVRASSLMAISPARFTPLSEISEAQMLALLESRMEDARNVTMQAMARIIFQTSTSGNLAEFMDA